MGLGLVYMEERAIGREPGRQLLLLQRSPDEMGRKETETIEAQGLNARHSSGCGTDCFYSLLWAPRGPRPVRFAFPSVNDLARSQHLPDHPHNSRDFYRNGSRALAPR